MSQTSTAPALVLRRTYATSRERLFSLWTDAANLSKWFCPGESKIEDARIDARPGGTYRIAMRLPDNELVVVTGAYREVTPPARLVFGWGWEDPDPEDTLDSVVTLEFIEHGPASTELVLTHEQLANDVSRANHERGWTAILDQLPTVL